MADLVEKCRYFEYDGVDFTVSGASLQLVDGTGVMDQRNGNGNLVVGYGNDVSGSHNIVIGHGHEVSPTGCLVVGRDHRILDDRDGSTITGGTDHMIRAPRATIRGGERSVVELDADGALGPVPEPPR